MMKIMEVMGYPEMIFAAICFLLLHRLNSKTVLTNWPVIGMLPSVLANLHRLHDWATDILSETECNFSFKGPWFTNMTDILVTSDPANMRHIFNTNFSNYPKGPEFKDFFHVLGDGIFNSDSDLWKVQRSIAHRLVNQEKFQCFLRETICDKLENALVPVLEHALEQNMVVDLQDLFKRFTFDTATIFLSGSDPGCVSNEFKKFPFLDALDDVEEAVFYRHVLPVSCWKLQKFLGIGQEKKLSKATECLDKFIAQCISSKRQKEAEKGNDLLTSYMEEKGVLEANSDKFLRDTVMNFLLAGRSTVTVALTWFFWLVSKNPIAESKIIEELKNNVDGMKPKMFDIKELHHLVYLHGAICEALRLFPSVPFEHKRPLHPDILPSGHRVDSRTKILPFIYSMGRMEKVWGKDCLEFKPERWISNKGEIHYVPSYKFMSFNSGPRICLGKGIAFTQMKLVAATLLWKYRIEVVDNHLISPKNSIILYMKHGMNVRLNRRV